MIEMQLTMCGRVIGHVIIAILVILDIETGASNVDTFGGVPTATKRITLMIPIVMGVEK